MEYFWGSGCESGNWPLQTGAPVDNPVVEPVFPALPELKIVGDQAVSAPMGRPGCQVGAT